MNRWWLYALIALLGLSLGASLAWFTQPAPPAPGAEGAQVGDVRPPFRHAGVDGQFVSADDFDGQASAGELLGHLVCALPSRNAAAR